MLAVGRKEAFLEFMTIWLGLFFLQKREVGLTVLTSVTYSDNKMSQRQLGLIK